MRSEKPEDRNQRSRVVGRKPVIGERTDPFRTVHSTLRSRKGIALVAALIITLIVFMLIMSALYVITSSTIMSGAGKRYATADEAADGAVEVMKEGIRLISSSEPVSSLPMTVISGPAGGLSDTILLDPPAAPTTVRVTLPAAGFLSSYTAQVTVQRLFSKSLPGGRIEFGRSASGPATNAIYYKITSVVTGTSDNVRAETSAVYRLTN